MYPLDPGYVINEDFFFFFFILFGIQAYASQFHERNLTFNYGLTPLFNSNSVHVFGSFGGIYNLSTFKTHNYGKPSQNP